MKIVAVEPVGITLVRAEEIRNQFLSLGHDFIYYPDRKEDASSLIERMQNADIVIVSNIPLGAEILSQCKNLKMLSVAFTGLDHIDLNYCKEHNIVVRNAAGYATTAVCEPCSAEAFHILSRSISAGFTCKEKKAKPVKIKRQS